MPANAVERLTARLVARIVSARLYRVVPRDQLKSRLRKLRRRFHRPRFAWASRAAVGKELAAGLVVHASLFKFGRRCTLGVMVYDLRTATTQRAAAVTGACDETQLRADIVAAVKQLAAADPRGHPPTATPIVAVFGVQPNGVSFSAKVLERFGDYLALVLASTRRFRVIAGGKVQRRLREQKLESYRRCYESRCQVEIGKELAAQQVVATQLTRAAEGCSLSVVSYGLATSLAENAAVSKTELGCAEEQVLESIDHAVSGLIEAGRRPPTSRQARSPGTTAPSSARRTVPLQVRSTPVGSLFVDGVYRGETPRVVAIDAGRDHKVMVVGSEHQPWYRTVRAGRSRRLDARLRLTQSAREGGMTRTEWIGLRLGGGAIFAQSSHAAFAATLRLGTYKWPHFWLRLLDIGVARAEEPIAVYFGPAAGLAFYLGGRGEHQLSLGLGLAYAGVQKLPANSPSAFSSKDAEVSVLAFVPGLEYTYMLGRFWSVGLTGTLVFPVAGRMGGAKGPLLVQVTAGIGLSLN